MKTIGLIGGMSWESTVTYYQIINQEVKQKLGGLHSAKCILVSVDFAVIAKYQSEGKWDKGAELLIQAAQNLERAGADFIVICTNTMHKVADNVRESVNIPLIHIGEATAKSIVKKGYKKVALLGTRYTMEQDFYKSELKKYELEAIVPCEEDRILINDVIFNELCLGNIKDSSRQSLLSIIDELIENGAEAIILACTEIGLLIKEEHTSIQLFDTTIIHAKEAVNIALNS